MKLALYREREYMALRDKEHELNPQQIRLYPFHHCRRVRHTPAELTAFPPIKRAGIVSQSAGTGRNRGIENADKQLLSQML